MIRHPGNVTQGGKAEELSRRVQAGGGRPRAFLTGSFPHRHRPQQGIHLETLRKWVRDDRTRTRTADGGGGVGVIPDDKEELKRLRRENARLKEDNEIRRKATAYFAWETTR